MFVKRQLIVLSFLFSLVCSASATPALIPSPPQIAAKGYILIDANSGFIITEHNVDEQLEPASLTKMMTSYVADYELAQGNISLDDTTTVSKNAWAQNPLFQGSSLMWLQAGKTVSVDDLLKGIAISSGNDATVALAEYVAGSEDAFVDIMNQHAQLLGMKDTHFVNPHGLPADNHYTTARDMATLAKAIIHDFPEQYKIYAEKSFTYNGITTENRNSLLWRDPSVDGLKTGHTEKAGYCLVASGKKDDMRLIAVVMGTKTKEARIQETQKLLSYGFRYYKTVKLYDKGQEIAQTDVWSGEDDTIALVAPDDIYVTVPRAKVDDIKAEMEIEQYIEAPIAKAQVLGDLIIMLDGKEQTRVSMIASKPVEEGGFFKVLWHTIKLFFIGLFS